MLERLRGKEVSIDFRKCRIDVNTNTNLSHFFYCWPAWEHIVWARLMTWERAETKRLKRKTYVWAGMFAKAPKSEPLLHSPETQPSFIFWLLLRAREQISLKSAPLMIDSPAHQASWAEWPLCLLLCCIFSRKCLWSHYTLQLSYSIISTDGGQGGEVRVGSWLTFNKEPLACWGKWQIRVCLWPF